MIGYRMLLPLMALSILACGSRHDFVAHPIPPAGIAEQPRMTYRFDHKLDPDPGYEPADIDAFSAKLSGIKTHRPRRHTPRGQQPVQQPVQQPTLQPARHPQGAQTQPVPGPQQIHVYHHHQHPQQAVSDPGHRYLNTLFWGGVGGIIGHQKGRAGEGALIGATYGKMLDRGGVHGLLTPGTAIGAAAGAAAGSRSGKAGRGALIGAGIGFLLDDVFR